MTFFIKILFETLFTLALFINAGFFVPQIILLLKTKNSENLSVTTFTGIAFSQLFTMLHALIVQDWLLFLGSFVNTIVTGFVSFLIIYYRIQNR